MKLNISKSYVFIFLLSMMACSYPSNNDNAKFLLLGEVHDNNHGHTKRYELLHEYIKKGWRPAIVLEQVDLEDQVKLDDSLRHCETTDCVVDNVIKKNWKKSFYKPIFELAKQYNLKLVAGNFSRKDAKKMMNDGMLSVVSPHVYTQFKMNPKYHEQLLKKQAHAVDIGHCGMAPEKMKSLLAQAQLARDVMMAKSMIDNSENGVVLIVGNGHIRNDIGVPYWLRSQKISNIRTIAFLESSDNEFEANVDQFYYVPKVDREDPCMVFKR